MYYSPFFTFKSYRESLMIYISIVCEICAYCTAAFLFSFVVFNLFSLHCISLIPLWRMKNEIAEDLIS